MKHFQHEREAAARPAGQRVYAHEPPVGMMQHGKSRARGSGFKRLFDMLDSNFWLLAGMTLVIAAVIMGWWVLSGEGPNGIRLFDQSRQAAGQTQPQTVAVTSQTVEQLEKQLTGLFDRVSMLTDSINYLESKLIRAHVLTDSIISAEQRVSSTAPIQPSPDQAARRVDDLPPAAAGQTAKNPQLADTQRATPPRISTASRQPTETAAAKTPAHLPQPRGAPSAAPARDTHAVTTTPVQPPAVKPVTAVRAQPGQWVVNLSSSPSQADADRFAAMARSRGVETQQQQVTVKGTDYWRVQTTGFPSAAEAQDYAGTVREKLGLQNVWITRR